MFRTKYNKFTNQNTRKKHKNNKKQKYKNNTRSSIKSNYVEKCLIGSSIIIKMLNSFFITFIKHKTNLQQTTLKTSKK